MNNETELKNPDADTVKPVSLRKNVTLSTFYQILSILTPVITAPYASRVLGDRQIGMYSYANSMETYFALFAALGTVSYGNRAIARERHDPHKRSVLFWEIELLTVFTGALVLLAWGALIFFSREYRVFYIILTVSLLETMMNVSWFFSGLEQFEYTIRQNAIFKLLGVVLLFLLVKKESDLLLYVALMTVTSFLGTLSMWIYLPRFLVHVDRKELHVFRHLRETIVYFIPTIATSVYTVLDKSLIQWITHDPYENGYYEQATKVVNMVKMVTFSAINSVMGSRIAYLFKEKRYDEIRRRIEDSANYILFIGIGYTFGMIGIAERFVPVFFGPGYGPVAPILSFLSPVVVIIGISNCLGSQFYTPAGYRKESSRYIIAGSVVNLVMNLLLIPRFQAIGAIPGTLAAETTITVLYVRHSRGYMTAGKLWKLSWKKLAAGGATLGTILALMKLIRHPILSILAAFAAGFLVYVLVLVLLRDSFLTVFLVQRVLKKGAPHCTGSSGKR